MIDSNQSRTANESWAWIEARDLLYQDQLLMSRRTFAFSTGAVKAYSEYIENAFKSLCTLCRFRRASQLRVAFYKFESSAAATIEKKEKHT